MKDYVEKECASEKISCFFDIRGPAQHRWHCYLGRRYCIMWNWTKWSQPSTHSFIFSVLNWTCQLASCSCHLECNLELWAKITHWLSSCFLQCFFFSVTEQTMTFVFSMKTEIRGQLVALFNLIWEDKHGVICFFLFYVWMQMWVNMPGDNSEAKNKL